MLLLGLGMRLQRVWRRLQAREDSEHEQALIRIAVAFVMYEPAGRSHSGQVTPER